MGRERRKSQRDGGRIAPPNALWDAASAAAGCGLLLISTVVAIGGPYACYAVAGPIGGLVAAPVLTLAWLWLYVPREGFQCGFIVSLPMCCIPICNLIFLVRCVVRIVKDLT